MTDAGYWLPLIWAGIIGLSVAMYVLLDGFDLGIGILFLTGEDEKERDAMMNSIAPYWDGNETWLVMGGAGLLVAFPLAYALILPAVYLPIMIMLLALVFRGVAFEFRFVSKPHHKWWDRAFAAGSVTATFCQGLVLGGFLQDIKVVGKQFSGGSFEWLTPFSVLCGLGLIAGYALLGSGWVMMKTEGPLARRAARYASFALIATLGFVVAVSVWTPLASDRIADRWFSWSRLIYLWPIPFITAGVALFVAAGVRKGSGVRVFTGAMALFAACFAGLGVSTFPYLVPPTITIWEAAAVPSTQMFSLAGALVLLPLILGYTAFVYWTFRGKVAEGGYH